MKATPQAAAARNSRLARSSEPGFSGAGGMSRSRWPGQRRRLRFRARSKSPARSASLALPMPEPPADHDAEPDQHRHPEKPGHEPFGDRADVADRPAAAVV